MMNNILESIKETWGKLSRPMQLGVGVFVLGVFLSLVLLGLFSRTEYQVLFSSLGVEDAGAVVSALQERGTPYKLTDGGSTVWVPEEDVFESRIALATSGVPTGGVVGFEIFNTTRLGETEADRQLRYQWALQGELTRTIRQINEVFGSSESLEQINSRLDEGQRAIECGAEVGLQHTWNAETHEFDPLA